MLVGVNKQIKFEKYLIYYVSYTVGHPRSLRMGLARPGEPRATADPVRGEALRPEGLTQLPAAS